MIDLHIENKTYLQAECTQQNELNSTPLQYFVNDQRLLNVSETCNSSIDFFFMQDYFTEARSSQNSLLKIHKRCSILFIIVKKKHYN